MEWRDMPPLSSLRAFSAFAETGSLTEAGDMLNVSHAAISQQLRGLEHHLGVALFDRRGRGLRLTEDGQALASAVKLGFGAIGAAVAQLKQVEQDRPVHVSVTPSFAGGWLMPRLTEFSERHPDISLRIDPSPQVVPLEPGGIDVALRFGSGDWPGLESQPLLMSPLVIVAAPSLVEGRVIREPADLARLPWIEELGTTEATNWLKTHGAVTGGQQRRTQLPGNLMVDSARAGQGVLITVRYFVEADLQSGRLLALFEERPDAGYHIVTGSGVLRSSVRAFVNWLARQAELGGPAT
ncbi:MAG: LysR family transcriptional regulator [Pseudomonadota bacterium]